MSRGAAVLEDSGIRGVIAPTEVIVEVPEDGPYETIGGFIMAALGTVPVVGDTVPVEGGSLRVERVDGRRVDRVRFIEPTDGDAIDQEEAR